MLYRILEESGLGIPKYYDWRSRSGCYFCFFQQRIEWVGLLEEHPDLYHKAMLFEQDKENTETGEHYTWSDREKVCLNLCTQKELSKFVSNIKSAPRVKLVPERCSLA
jgi:hypothetical protein